MSAEAKSVDWPIIFEQYERSGLNQVKFCEREGLKFARLTKSELVLT
jgi:hypothetical protein